MGGGERVELRDGTGILVRPIEPEDKEALRVAFEALSERSRYQRFFTSVPHLSAAQMRYLTEVDHHDHEALVAIAGDDRVVGVARYVREAPGSDTAEVAVTVADDWQGRGVATALLDRLGTRAEREGIDHLSAYALATNDDVLAVLHDLGPLEVVGRDGGVTAMRIDLEPRFGPQDPLRRALRAAASTEIDVPFLSDALRSVGAALRRRQ